MKKLLVYEGAAEGRPYFDLKAETPTPTYGAQTRSLTPRDVKNSL